MIWNFHLNTESQRHAVEHYLMSDMTDAGLRVDVEDHALREVARGVAESYRGLLDGRVATSVHYSTITASISQALWTIGEENAVFSYMERRNGISTAVNPLRNADRRIPAGPMVFHALSSQTVRAMSWVTEGNELVWVLDMNRLIEGGGLVLEMEMRRRVRGVLEDMAIAWAPTRGRGVFGILRLDKTADIFVGGRTCTVAQKACWMEELLGFFTDVMTSVAGKRNWPAVPEIRCFDL